MHDDAGLCTHVCKEDQKNARRYSCLQACGSKCPDGAAVRLMGHLDCDATIFTIAVLANVCGGSAYLPHAVKIGDSCYLFVQVQEMSVLQRYLAGGVMQRYL